MSIVVCRELCILGGYDAVKHQFFCQQVHYGSTNIARIVNFISAYYYCAARPVLLSLVLFEITYNAAVCNIVTMIARDGSFFCDEEHSVGAFNLITNPLLNFE